MRTRILAATAIVLGLGISLASNAFAAGETAQEPPKGEYKKVSTLVKLPDFLPGIGTLYVQPKTLPAGPFLAYYHAGKLVSTIYMIPLKDMDAHKTFDDLGTAHARVNHVDFYFNAGHPGVEEPHYHVVLWYISAKASKELK
jgi:hypothetical protein